MLKCLGIDTKNLDVEKLRSDYNTLYSKKETLQKTYRSAVKEHDALVRKLDNLNQYLDAPQASAANKKIEKIPNPSKFDIDKKMCHSETFASLWHIVMYSVILDIFSLIFYAYVLSRSLFSCYVLHL